MDYLPAALDDRVRSELRENEQMVWAGQPRPGRFLRASLPMALFGLPFTAFAVVAIYTAYNKFTAGDDPGGPRGFGAIILPLFSVPFLLVGLGMLTSPYWMYRRALKTCYCLTNGRAIVWTVGWFGSLEVRSYQAEQLGKMTRRDYADGSGDLVFEEFLTVSRDSDGYSRSQRTERGFIAVENVREVEDLLRHTLLKTA